MKILLKTRCGCSRWMDVDDDLGSEIYIPLFPDVNSPYFTSLRALNTHVRKFVCTRYDMNGTRHYLEVMPK